MVKDRRKKEVERREKKERKCDGVLTGNCALLVIDDSTQPQFFSVYGSRVPYLTLPYLTSVFTR